MPRNLKTLQNTIYLTAVVVVVAVVDVVVAVVDA